MFDAAPHSSEPIVETAGDLDDRTGGTNDVGGRHQRRPPTWYRPGRVYFNGGMLLIFTFGMMLAAIGEAYTAKDTGWMIFFIAGAIGCAGVYSLIVCAWVGWMADALTVTDVDTDDDTDVNFWRDYGHDYRSGDT